MLKNPNGLLWIAMLKLNKQFFLKKPGNLTYLCIESEYFPTNVTKSDQFPCTCRQLKTDAGTEKFLSKIILAQGIRSLGQNYLSLFGVKRSLSCKHPCNDVFSLMR